MDRLQILLDTKQIQQNTFNFAKKLYLRFEQLNLSNIDGIITHVVIAIERIKASKKVEAMNLNIKNEIYNSQKIQKANDYFEKAFFDSFVQITNSEKDYILLHIINSI